MTDAKKTKRALSTILLVLGAVAGGVVLAQLLPADLLGLRHGHEHGRDLSMADTTDEAAEGLWTCGMHPHVLEHGPGPCPICGMKMTPVPDSGEAASPGGSPEILFYRNPMDPTITSPVPAKDSMGMDYVPVTAEDGDPAKGSGAVVRIDPAVVQNMNVRTEAVTRRDLTRPIRTVGTLDFDQQRMVTVTTKYSGWVEKVYVNYVGEKVKRGQPLFDIYSPELVQTQQELLSAIRFAEEMQGAPEDARQRALSMVESARVRLGYWDISPRQVARLEETGEVFRTLEVASPAGGLVMKRVAGLGGMAVRPGLELFHIADLSNLWLSVELFEGQLAWVREGTKADISLPYFPGETFHGRVRFLEPELSEKTRTMRAKIEVPNRDGLLRSGMYATVELHPVQVRDALAVPTQAVLRTGQRDVVVVALGEGRFAPREVTLGHEAEGFAEILSGLEEGVEVVTSAQFLLDSESTLRAVIQKMIAGRDRDATVGEAAGSVARTLSEAMSVEVPSVGPAHTGADEVNVPMMEEPEPHSMGEHDASAKDEHDAHAKDEHGEHR